MNTKPLALALALAGLALASPSSASQQLACEMLVSTWRADSETGKKIPVPGATVTVADVRSGWSRTKITNHSGRQIFRGIRADASGHQTVTVEAAGYETQVYNDIECPVGQRIQGRFVLEKPVFANGFE
ncbi:carboxypeptidase-like regulatory domain-containing protein [Pseudomarimonas arenosa]|uniref:Carboxypeptidase regulatory-like domain-containing protein n=1 Tax=Pseudomarimonas arenosa TaxID=2774145 RepID=A0AAW3ZQ47_9GAMM|nr:carboxypeptidase-like regulatory domain-containing protein [Pseudomarimonas arenosa]MBD8527277.1 carboxypeptidase regulatory-like domain-containing protein [Pseudomarimonas arenosa]